MRRFLLCCLISMLATAGLVVPSQSALAADGYAGVTLDYDSEHDYTWSGVTVNTSDTPFLAAYNGTAWNRRSISVIVSYVDSSGPWDFVRYTTSGSDRDSNAAAAPLPPQFRLDFTEPNSSPTTHLAVSLAYLDASGAKHAITSDLIQFRAAVPEVPVEMNVSSWTKAVSGYSKATVSIPIDARRTLRGQPCEFGCNRELWGVTGEGEKVLIATSASSPFTTQILYSRFERLVPALANVSGSLRHFGVAYAMPGAQSVVYDGVDLDATTSLIDSLALGLGAIDICRPMNSVRLQSDGSTTAAFLQCTEAYEIGGTRGVVYNMLNKFGKSAVARILSALVSPPGEPAPDVERPRIDPNPLDPPAPLNPPTIGDIYFAEIDRIEARLATADASRALEPTEVRTLARTCYAYASALVGAGSECERMPVFMPGIDVFEAARHKSAAILAYPEWVQLTRGTPSSTSNRQWYANEPECQGRSVDLHCDEYPYFASRQAGPATVDKPRASLRLVTAAQNLSEGGQLGGFLARCKVAEDDPFLVVPTVFDNPDPSRSPSIVTVSFCGQ